MKPATAAALETASELSASAATGARQLVRQGSVHGAALHRTASQRAGQAWRGLGKGGAKLWKGTGPTVQGYAAAAQVRTVTCRQLPCCLDSALNSGSAGLPPASLSSIKPARLTSPFSPCMAADGTRQ